MAQNNENNSLIDDTKDLGKIISEQSKHLKKIKPLILDHIKTICEVVNAMNNMGSSNSGIQALLETVPSGTDKDGKPIVNDKSLLILKVIDNVAQVISRIPKFMTSIAEMDLGWRAVNKIRNNLKRIPIMFHEIFQTMISGLKEVLTSDTLDFFRVLQGEGDSIERKVAFDSQGNVIFDGDKKAIMNEIEKKGKMGLMDVFLKTFDIFDRIGKLSEGLRLNPVSYLRFRINVKILKHQLEIIMKSLAGVFKNFSDKNTSDEWENIAKSISSISQIVVSLDGIINELTKFSLKFLVLAPLIRRALIGIGFELPKSKKGKEGEAGVGIFGMLRSLVCHRGISDLAYENTLDSINQISSLVDILNNIANKLMVFADPKLSIAGFMVRWGLSALSKMLDVIIGGGEGTKNGILDKLIKIDREKISNTISGLESIGEVFNQLNSLMKSIIFAGVLIIPALIAGVALLAFLWVFIPIVNVLTIVANRYSDKSLEGTRKNLLELAVVFAALVVVELAMLAAGAIAIKYWKELLIGLVCISILFIAMGGALWLISKLIDTVITRETMISLLLLSSLIAILIIDVMLMVALSYVVDKMKWIPFLYGIGLLLGGILAIIGIGLALAFFQTALIPAAVAILAATAVLTIIIGALLIISVSILLIQKVMSAIGDNAWDEAKTKSISDSVMSVLQVTYDILFEVWKKFILSNFIKPRKIARVMRRISKIIRSVKKIAESLSYIAELKIPDTISEKTKLIMGTVLGDETTQGILPTILKMRRAVEKRKAVRQTKKLLRQVSGVTLELGNIVNNINSIASFKVDKKIIEEKITDVIQMVDYVNDTITKELINGGAEMTAREERRKLRQDKRKMRQSAKLLSNVDSVILEVTDIVESFNKIAKFELKKDNIETALTKIFTSINDFIKFIDGQTIGGGVNMQSISFQAKINQLSRLADITQEFIPDGDAVDRHKNFIDGNIKFLDKVNNMDIEKLKTTSSLFEKMADFSNSIKGDFDELAESLNEKIAPLLEELKNSMEGVGKKVEESGANMSASISANSSNTNMSATSMSAQVQRENPDMSPAEVQRIVDQRMGEQARRQSSGLESKLEELLDLFRSGQARVALR